MCFTAPHASSRLPCLPSTLSYSVRTIVRVFLSCLSPFSSLGRDTLEARLRDKKDMYKDLALSDALARELRRVPEDDQTIKV